MIFHETNPTHDMMIKRVSKKNFTPQKECICLQRIASINKIMEVLQATDNSRILYLTSKFKTS